MKTNQYIQKTPQEIASELFQGTKVESAFDKKGKFSHLLAKLSKNEFFKLYSPETTVTIFIQGFWLQLCLKQKNKQILNRKTNTILNLEIYNDEFGMTILDMKYLGKKVGKFKFKHISSSDLPYTTDGYYAIARSAVKVFSKIQNNYNWQKINIYQFPVVQIIPEENFFEVFDSNLVNLQ